MVGSSITRWCPQITAVVVVGLSLDFFDAKLISGEALAGTKIPGGVCVCWGGGG